MFFRGQEVGKYKILSAIGSGGFGTVYLAQDTWIDKQVAIKVPHRQNVDFSDLLQEARLLGSLNHPNIVSILTAEKHEGVFFIVMEYVPGETLENIIIRNGTLELRRALDYTCQICNAIAHAHRQKVLHRDLRPGNVLITDSGIAKVTDFGTSRFLEMAAHGTTVIGSPPYMAPEQFRGQAVFGSDIYSLGVTMYQMLTGTLPYETPSPAELEKLTTGELVTPPRVRNPKIPEAVADIILKAMAPVISARFARADDLLEAILAIREAPGVSLSTRPRRVSSARASAGRAPAPAVKTPPRRGARPEPPAPASQAVPQPRFCWHCRKPLAARVLRCVFCGETQ